MPTIGDFTASPPISSSCGVGSPADAEEAGAAVIGAAETGAGAVTKAVGASRRTLILRSPSSTSISLRSLAVSISASSRTRAVSTRIDAPLSPPPLPVSAITTPLNPRPERAVCAASYRFARPRPVKAGTAYNCVEAPTFLSALSEMSVDSTLQVRINGEHRRVNEGISIAELVREIGFDPIRVAVERNLEVVPRSTLAEVAVQDGDEFEIVRFVGGG